MRVAFICNVLQGRCISLPDYLGLSVCHLYICLFLLCLFVPPKLILLAMQVMYAEPMGSKVPPRSPQLGLSLDHLTPLADGEEVLQPPHSGPGVLHLARTV